ncbi:MAG: alpha/beta hydrolase [Arenibacterium sp.]
MRLFSKCLILVCLLFVAGCGDRSFTPVVPEAVNVGKPITVFAGSSRLPETNGNFGFQRSERLRHLETVVTVPPSHELGDLRFGYANPNPERQFTLAAQSEFESPDAFKARLRAALAELPPDRREITVFVHGYNSTQSEAIFRAAQLKHDIQVPVLLLTYSWPSRGRALPYAYDTDRILFARVGMAQLLRQVTDVGADRVLVVAHSMGGAVTMETLRQMDLKSPGWAARALSSIVLISPDLDVDVFRSQMARLSGLPNPFVIFVSRRDGILRLSSRIRGTSPDNRLGSIDDIERIMDLPIEVIDATAFADNAGSPHFIAATSPALISMIRQARAVSEMFDTDETSLAAVLTGRPQSQNRAQEFEITQRGLFER